MIWRSQVGITSSRCLVRGIIPRRTAHSPRWIRSFHRTTAQSKSVDLFQDPYIGPVLAAPHQLFELFHSVGLPWAAAIPLTALTVRVLIYLPLIGIPNRQTQQRLLDVQPLLHAHMNILSAAIGNQHMGSGLKAAQRMYRSKLSNYRWSLYMAFKCHPLLNVGYALAQLPIFLLCMESVRRMVGTNSTILGLLLERISSKAKDLFNYKAVGGPLAGENDPWFEPSLASEGSLWFQDLTAPDPTLTLSFAVSAMTIAHIFISSGRSSTKKGLGGMIRRGIALSVALAIGPLTFHVPSAVMLYWLSSSTGAVLQDIILNKILPFKYPPKPCKRR